MGVTLLTQGQARLNNTDRLSALHGRLSKFLSEHIFEWAELMLNLEQYSMPTECISFRESRYFSALICDYIEQNENLSTFYHRFPTEQSFKAQIAEKRSFFTSEKREVLVNALHSQYKNITVSKATAVHIDALRNSETFTVATGHQLNIFTGPLYFLYKIVSAINLAKQLQVVYPEQHFVPVYWMATEDHDFEEINYFNFKGKKFQWNKDASGPVGRLTTDGLGDVFALFAQDLGSGLNAEQLKTWFKDAYLKHDKLTDATRYLVNELFGQYGLVIIDGDHKELKKEFIPYMKNDLLVHNAFQKVSETSEALAEQQYTIQVNPREINLFYIKDGLRERIVSTDNGGFAVNDTHIGWSKDNLLNEIEQYPERFSPNVLLRPLYQEVILPNLCYIGGGGEIAYWLQLKSFFEAEQVPFPVLLLRNSVLLVNDKEAQKLKKLHIPYKYLFLKRHSFINRKVREISDIDINFDPQRKHLKEQFASMYVLAEQTDKTFLGAVKAQEVKQLKGLDALEKRLLKAQKRKLSDQVTRMTDLQEILFPHQSLQERSKNFSEFYAEYGTALLTELFTNLDPLHLEFMILVMDE